MAIPEQEIAEIFRLLKAHLKQKKLSYRTIAQRIRMSESNLKRIFSEQSCGLEHLIKICRASEISLFDLIGSSVVKKVPSYQLSLAAEDYFLSNFENFIFYRSLAGSNNPDVFIKNCGLPMEKIKSVLSSLEKLNLLRNTREGIDFIVSGYLELSKSPRLLELLKKKWVPWFFERILEAHSPSEYSLELSSTGLTSAHKEQLVNEVKHLIERYKIIGAKDQESNDPAKIKAVGLCIGIGPHRVGYFENVASKLIRAQ